MQESRFFLEFELGFHFRPVVTVLLVNLVEPGQALFHALGRIGFAGSETQLAAENPLIQTEIPVEGDVLDVVAADQDDGDMDLVGAGRLPFQMDVMKQLGGIEPLDGVLGLGFGEAFPFAQLDQFQDIFERNPAQRAVALDLDVTDNLPLGCLLCVNRRCG